jgi:hypothetical protein
METKRKRPPRASETAPTAGGTLLPAETPAEILLGGLALGTESTPGEPAADDPGPDEIAQFRRDAIAALAESQAATARCLAAMSDAMAGLTRSGIDNAARTATDMLAVRTLSDAYEVSALFARKSFDSLLDGSAELSGLGVKLAAEASRPILTQWGQSWIRAACFAR